MPYSPTSPYATACATDLAARITTAGVPVTSQDTTVALLDNVLCSTSFQAQSSATCGGSTSTSSTSFADITGMPTISFTAPIAKSYLIHLQFVGFFQSTGTSGIKFQIVNTSSGFTTSTVAFIAFPSATNVRTNISVVVPMSMVQGANSHKIQWACAAAAQTANADTSCSWVATFTG